MPAPSYLRDDLCLCCVSKTAELTASLCYNIEQSRKSQTSTDSASGLGLQFLSQDYRAWIQ